MLPLAYCGLVCETCPIHLLAQESDPEKREAIRAEVIRVSREHYGVELAPADVNECDGCRADTERLFSGCRNCPIRPCAAARGIESCAHCAEYPCPDLERFFALEPAARERLDGVRAGLQSQLSNPVHGSSGRVTRTQVVTHDAEPPSDPL